jgi:hypothetical protein
VTVQTVISTPSFVTVRRVTLGVTRRSVKTSHQEVSRRVIPFEEECGQASRPRVARFFLIQFTKTEKNLPNYPNGHKIYQMAVICMYVLQMAVITTFQMALKYSNTFYLKALQNLPKLGFFGLKIYIPSGNPEPTSFWSLPRHNATFPEI